MALSRVPTFNQEVYLAERGNDPEKLYGVQSFEADWTLPLSVINAGGYGIISNTPQGEIAGTVNVSRLVTESGKNDPLIQYSAGGGLLEQPLTGFFAYGTVDPIDQGFTFDSARVTSYSSAASVGAVASSDFSLDVYGTMMSGTGITLGGSGTNAIQSYDFNINLNWSPLYGLGGGARPVGYRLNYPLEISLNFEMIVSDYETEKVYNLLCNPRIENLGLSLNHSCSPDPILKINVPDAQLQGTSFSSTVNDNLMASLSYVAYVAKSGELETIFPALE